MKIEFDCKKNKAINTFPVSKINLLDKLIIKTVKIRFLYLWHSHYCSMLLISNSN